MTRVIFIHERLGDRVADGLGRRVVLGRHLAQPADAHFHAFGVNVAHRRQVGFDDGLRVRDRLALHGLGNHRSGRHLRQRRVGRERPARAAALHGQRVLEYFRVGLRDRIAPENVVGRRAVADPLAVHGERGFVTGFLDQFADLRRPVAERVGDAVNLDAKLLFEDLLGFDHFLVHVAVHAELLDVRADELHRGRVHQRRRAAEVVVVVGVALDVHPGIPHFGQLVPLTDLPPELM